MPNHLLDDLIADLPNAEFKCLCYLVRHTFGYGKSTDQISLEQFSNGVVKRDGTRVDRGTGLGRSAVAAALQSLKTRGLIDSEEVFSAEGVRRPSRFWLVLEDAGEHRPENWTVPSGESADHRPETRTETVPKSGPTILDQPILKQKGIHPQKTVPSKFTRGRLAPCPTCKTRPCQCEVEAWG